MPAKGKYAPFRLWALVLAWIFQLLFLMFVLGLYIIVCIAISLNSDNTSSSYVGVGFEIALAATSIILIIIEIALCASYILSPLFYLVSNVLKSTIWVGITIATLVINHGYRGDTWSGIAYNGIGIGVSVALMLLFLIPMIYAAILYHKDRKVSIGQSAYGYSIPDDSESIRYEGAPVPRPEFVDMEDGQSHGFLKVGSYR